MHRRRPPDGVILDVDSSESPALVHGRYDPRDLPDLLAHYRVSLVLYPSAGPETFSYTLSEAWSAGRPVLVPPIGALPERVAPTGAGWVLDDAEWRDERRMLDRIEALLSPARAGDLARASRAAAAMSRITLESMAEATLACYEAALRGRRPAAQRPLARERVRDALGYRPWTPPVPQRAEGSARGDAASRFAQTALKLRQSSAGPLLRAITPGFLREALKARLK